MAKRFTDSGKWRNEWFRTLPMEAKLVWSYICDECDYAGIWKADYGLASFQLAFNLSQQQLANWFPGKVHFFGDDGVLIIPFFEFQYGQSKDTWNAKVTARVRLETLGFQVFNNKVLIPSSNTDCHPTVLDSGPLVLNTGTVTGKGIVNSKEEDNSKNSNPPPQDPFFKTKFDKRNLPIIAELWNKHCGEKLTKLSMTTANWNRACERISANYSDDEIKAAVEAIAENKFLTGGSKGKWKATFSWLIKDNGDNIAKVLNGDYDNEQSVSAMLAGMRDLVEAS